MSPSIGRSSGAEQAERLSWAQKWDRVLGVSNPQFVKGFMGATLNAACNCVDRNVESGRGNKIAFHRVGEPEGDTRDLTYTDLQAALGRRPPSA
ncbi:acetyl-coenzyme A synthetase N-terminal domain-containing protein [Saccharopolyspora sp. NPDC000995]